jgi:hypothetical protein
MLSAYVAVILVTVIAIVGVRMEAALTDSLYASGRKLAEDSILALKAKVSPEVIGTIFAYPDGSYISSAGARGNIADRYYFRQVISGGVPFAVSSPVISKSLGV